MKTLDGFSTADLVLPEQTRSLQSKLLRQSQAYKWLVAIRLKTADCGLGQLYKLSSFIWVPATLPDEFIPWLPVMANDPRKEMLLSLLIDDVKAAAGTAEVAPYLIQSDHFARIERAFHCYEYPFEPDVYVCPACKTLLYNDPRNFVPNGCLSCNWTATEKAKWQRLKEI